MKLMSTKLQTEEPMAANQVSSLAFTTRPFLITFSGIDGAGKTTQIEHLESSLQERGLRVLRFSFWDHVAAWSKMRAGVGNQAAHCHQSDRIAEGPFIPKNNKHIRKWYLAVARAGFYLLDVARLRRLLSSQDARTADVIIFDRYIYDQIANIYSSSFAARIYGKILLQRTPAPDLAFFLDASPAAAFARKPEYPLEFMFQNRRSFLRLRERVPELIVIPDAGTEDVKSEICFHIRRSRLAERNSSEGKTEAREGRRSSPAPEFL
jgi:thymidylate kinase